MFKDCNEYVILTLFLQSYRQWYCLVSYQQAILISTLALVRYWALRMMAMLPSFWPRPIDLALHIGQSCSHHPLDSFVSLLPFTGM